MVKHFRGDFLFIQLLRIATDVCLNLTIVGQLFSSKLADEIEVFLYF